VAAGMQQALPSRQDTAMTMQAWHDQVCSAHPGGESALQIESPGRFWNQMAGEIFLANYTSTLWGWSSQASIRLLDYWLTFDPAIIFLMICTDPVTALAEAICSELPQENIPGFMSDWHTSTKEMLRIYNRHPERCLLLEYRQCCAAPEALLRLCNHRLGLALNSSTAIPASSDKLPDPLPLYLAHALLKERPELHELQLEIESTYIQLPTAEAIQTDHVRPALDAIVDEYRSLLATETESNQQLDTIHELQARLGESGKDLDELHRQLNSAKEQTGAV